MRTPTSRPLRPTPCLPERLERRRLLTTYTVIHLADAGLAGTVVDLNDAGQVAGNVAGRAVLWREGRGIDLGTLGGASSEARAVSRHGQVVGSSATAGGAAAAFLWRDGAIEDLGLGDDSDAVAINNAVQIAANVRGRAVLWHDGAVTDLGELTPGGGAAAADMNDAGQVVGSSYTGAAGVIGLPVVHTFVWQGGVMTDLGTPPFTISSYPSAINSVGQVAGSATVYVNTGYGAAVLSRAIFYDGGQMVQVPAPALQSVAADVNDAGRVVGTMWGATGARAFVYDSGVVTDLNALVAPGSGTVVSGATAINNAGQILAYDTAGRPVLLTPQQRAERVIDDGDAGFSTSGPRPAVMGGQGFGGDERRLIALQGPKPASSRLASRLVGAASWTTGGLAPGLYRVSATWTPGPDRASSAVYSVSNGRDAPTTVAVDQRVAPADFGADGAGWKNLGVVSVAGGTLTVRLNGRRGAHVIADAVRVERIGPTTTGTTDNATPAAARPAASSPGVTELLLRKPRRPLPA